MPKGTPNSTHRLPHLIDNDASKIIYVCYPNPKTKTYHGKVSPSWKRYYKYRVGMSIREAIRKGIRIEDLRNDVAHDYIKIAFVLIGDDKNE